MDKSTKVKMTGRKKIFLIAGVVLGVLVILYFGFAIFFMNHFFLGTTINGMNISGYSVEKVKEKTENSISDYKLEITDRQGQTEVLEGTSFGLQLQWDDSISKFLNEQNAFAWPVGIFSKTKLESETVVSYDKQKMEDAIRNLSFMAEENQVMPVNAAISPYGSDGYTIEPSKEGTAIDETALLTAAENKIYALESALSLEEESCYKEPEIKEDNEALLAVADKLNKYLGAEITYQVGNVTKVLDKETFHTWLSVSDNLEIVVDEQQVKEYVSALGKEFNTCYSAKDFKTSYGKNVTIKNSHYGWKVDPEGEKAQILAELEAGQPVTRDLVYSMTANSHDGNDYGNSYVEINLTSQHLFLYKNGKLIIETDFVSGDVSDGNGSPTGAFGITYLDKDATLSGATYESHVDYWMPFAGNVGMHDATWRNTFGAAIYKRNGSHGCINLPWSAAKTIFENVEANYPVLVYELPGSESSRGVAQEQAYKVIDAINSIGKDPAAVTLDKESLVTEVRQKYDALSEQAKSYVTNYQKLTAAENAIAQLKAAQENTTQENSEGGEIPPAIPEVTN